MATFNARKLCHTVPKVLRDRKYNQECSILAVITQIRQADVFEKHLKKHHERT